MLLTTLTRKEKNFIDREQKLISLALSIMRDDGFAALTMDKLSSLSDYSKGTIYNHFTCKEDVLSAIGINCLTELNTLFSRAQSFNGNTRERLIAVQFSYMLNAILKPEQFMCVLSCKTSSVAEKASAKHQQSSVAKETTLLHLLNSLVEDAYAIGDLENNSSRNSDAITFCNWSISFGSLALMIQANDAQLIKKLDMQNTFLYNINVTLDGLGWKPLSSQWDYKNSIKRIKNEIFAEEVSLINKQT